ncbi:MAG: YciI family protein [Gammaproteobacteria bacterium]
MFKHTVHSYKKYYDENIFITTGAKILPQGSIIMANTDLRTANEIVKQDPFYQNEIEDYRFIEFNADRYVRELAGKLKK